MNMPETIWAKPNYDEWLIGGWDTHGKSGGTIYRRAALPSVDELAQIIRKVDGNHDLGAGALAEAILAALVTP